MANWSKTTLDEMEWQPVEGFPDVWMKFLGESLEDGPWVMQVRHGLWPSYVSLSMRAFVTVISVGQ